MSQAKIPPKAASLPESAQIWDISDGQFVTAYRTDFRRQKTIKLIDAITFNASVTSKTGSIFEVPAYRRGLLLIDLVVTSSPTDIVFNLEFSVDRINWYKYMIGPFGDLRYEDAAGDKTECLDFPILAPFMRMRAVATGTSGSNKFLTTVKASMTG